MIFKGIVFNEMKGAMSTPESLFVHHAQRSLLPSHTYSNNSGGDPLCIPDLTWQQLKDFHASHYHPNIPRELRWSEPREKHVTCPADPMAANPDKQTTVGVHYLTGRFALNIC
ncbi:Presequence protease, mitochondrial [Desmophyllum pertusum]|uniref:Presequence protease, mitochondrial n=1 Tax=Desmophyllum pertusum TaxID=174260 RepID=A0A9W9ZPU2_9CNID|nr:Presequence protease, mitochondrial [Desmophyllum pertusum]